MNLYASVKKNLLKESVKYADLSDDYQEKLHDGKTLDLYKCDNCGAIFDIEDSASRRTDMESYYGVGSDFPDHHYQDFSVCPHCNSEDISEEGHYDLDSFIDSYIDDNYEQVYNAYCETYPEEITSDTTLEDVNPQQLSDLVKDKYFS